MSKPPRQRGDGLVEPAELRIIGGAFRGRKLRHEPLRIGNDLVTRPMKHRVREAIFNLVGPAAQGAHAIDLFAGTGALGLEALSRGAVWATFIEKHVPTAQVVSQNIAALGVEDRTTLLTTSAFLWGKRDLPKAEGARGAQSAEASPKPSDSAFSPWLVFCSPPYAFFVDRQAEMLELVRNIQAAALPGSVVVVEADERFDFETLKRDDDTPGWDVRSYPPAVVGIWRC